MESNITAAQRKELERLWFVYGNNGKKHTHHNHRFIQNFLESGEDTEEFYRSADKLRTLTAGIKWETIALTEECVRAVRNILDSTYGK